MADQSTGSTHANRRLAIIVSIALAVVGAGALPAAATWSIAGVDPESRQFGVVVLDDGGAGWTGTETLDLALDRRGDDGRLSVQGNTLVSSEVVDAAITAAETAAGSLGDRLIAGLIAGADAGGDSRCGEQTATAAALLIARPGDEPYAFTDIVPFTVDPNMESVPSVFVSVLLRSGSERAPDRLAQIWSGVDETSPSIAIRLVEDGAATATARTLMLGLLGIFAVIGTIVILLIIRSRQRAGSS